MKRKYMGSCKFMQSENQTKQKQGHLKKTEETLAWTLIYEMIKKYGTSQTFFT